MRISVIVPAYNEEKLIAATLASIRCASQDFKRRGWDTEFVVCNNNSTDRTAEIATAAGARVVFEPINQIGRARNTGARHAEGDWLIFVDADSHPSGELFADVAAEMQSGRCLAGGSTVRLDRYHPVAAVATRVWNLLSRLRRWAPGSFIFCEAAAFSAVGGFDEQFFASEEIDLFQRLKERARAQGKQIRILHRHPVLTSARKLDLYSTREHLRFLASLIMGGKRVLRSREACPTWYDGRR